MNGKLFAVVLAGIASAWPGLAQNLFRNLDFERAVIVPLEGNAKEVATTNGLPNWTAYTWDGRDYSIHYNEIALDSPAVSIHDTNSQWAPILQGQYTLALQYSQFFNVAAMIAQTGWVPLSAKSLRFTTTRGEAPSLLAATLGGTQVGFTLLGAAPGGGFIWAADVSAFAGQSVELRFLGTGYLDDIKFSSQPILRPPSLADPKIKPGGNFEFTLLGQAGQAYSIQFSTNLVNWITLTNTLGSTNLIIILDETASNASIRFYRSVSP
jgi:hypothetical protein